MTPEQIRAMREGKPLSKQPINQQQMAMVPAGTEQNMMIDPMMGGAMIDPSMYNPALVGSGGPNIKTMDRWVSVKFPKSKEDREKVWVTETDLIEELVKANVPKEEYNWFVREYYEIEAVRGGDGNQKWAEQRQRVFLLKLELTRARPDNKDQGMRDALLLLTQNINQKSDVKMPNDNVNTGGSGGFFGLLRRGDR